MAPHGEAQRGRDGRDDHARAQTRERGARRCEFIRRRAFQSARVVCCPVPVSSLARARCLDPSTLVIPSSRLTVRSNSSSNSTKKIQAPGILGKGAFTVVLKGTFTPSSTATATTMGLAAGANDEASGRFQVQTAKRPKRFEAQTRTGSGGGAAANRRALHAV